MGETSSTQEALQRVAEAKRKDLRKLDLSDLEDLTELPSSITQLTQLVILDFSNTEIDALPDWIGQLAGLELLVFANTPVRVLPDTLRQLTKLRAISFSNTQVDALPECLGQLADLAFLSFANTRVDVLPEWLGRLTNLTDLFFRGTQVDVLPDWIGQLSNLSSLVFANTRIKVLPDTLRQLTNLTDLTFWATQVSVLPDWIGQLTKLERLDFRDTPVPSLPHTLGQLTNLKILHFSPGRITNLPLEIARQGTTAILDYLRSLQRDDGGREQWHAKLVVAGEAKAGKTSLVRALVGEPHDPKEPMTHGVRVVNLPINHPDRVGVEMHLSIWDFGGQRTYRSAHRFYMTDQSLFILAFNCREEWDDRRMREWLKAITARAKSSPILLVGTHARQHRHRLPLETLRTDFPQIAPDVFYVDCEEQDQEERLGIQQLHAAIAHSAAGLPLMGVRWPQPWLDAVQAIVDLPQNHASYEDVDRAMAGAGLDAPETRSALLAALHYRGEILHFATEPEIADTVVLHPMWVDGHVTKILDSGDVHDRNGLLSRTELLRAWPDTAAELRGHLLGLMEAFDLAYRVDSPDHDDLCLIVDRLPHDPPSYQAVWDAAAAAPGADEVRLIIDFGGPVLLAGIPTWFIAREHRFTTNTHWRYGALLVDRFNSGCHALVVADDNRGGVELAVRGTAPVRFLSVLKDGLLTPLQQRYPYLAWKIHIPCPCRDLEAKTGAEAKTSADVEPCAGKFEEAYLEKVTALGRATVECRESLAEVSVDRLRYGLRAAPLAQIAADIKAVARTVNNIERLELTALDLQRATTALQQAQSQYCPSVFTLAKLPKRLGLGTRYRLRLFCEQPNEWHPLPDEHGVFIFTKKPAWLDKCAPYLRILIPVLEHTLPLVGPAVGLAGAAFAGPTRSTADYVADLWSDERLTQELEVMRQLVDTLPALADEESATEANLAKMLVYGDRNPLRRASDYADFRALRLSLDALAPQGTDPWGGLTPMVTPEGIAIFVCQEHAKQYQFPRQEHPGA